MNIRFFYLVLLLYLLVVHTGFSQTGVTKADYFQLIKEAEEKIWQTFEATCKSWEKNHSLKSESYPAPQLYWGRLEGLLYMVTGELKYAERARKILLESSQFYSYYGIRVLKQIEKSGLVTEADLKVINQKILEDAERALQYWVEWGAHNLCTNHIVNPLTAAMLG